MWIVPMRRAARSYQIGLVLTERESPPMLGRTGKHMSSGLST